MCAARPAMTDPAAGKAALPITNLAVLRAGHIIVLLPTLILAMGFQLLSGLIIALGCAGVLVLLLRDPSKGPRGVLARPVDWRLLTGAIAIAAAFLVIGGHLHLFHAPVDWRTRDAVLADLALSGFPVRYVIDGADHVLRAPLGMYLMPGLMGQIAGLSAAHVAMLLQNSIFLGIILYLLAQVGRGWRHSLVLLFCGTCAILGIAVLAFGFGVLPWNDITLFGFDAWNPLFQYSSTAIQYFWTPNHALPGWWLALLCLLAAEDEVDGATVGLTFGGALLWSPLAVLAGPLLLLPDWRRQISNRRIWMAAAAGLGFIPVALYLTHAAQTIPHGAISFTQDEIVFYALMMAAMAPHALYIIHFRNRLPARLRTLALFSLCLLAVIPMVKFGGGNDFVMRGSIAPLAVVWFAFAYIWLTPGQAKGTAGRSGALIAALCAAAGVFEISLQTVRAPWGVSACAVDQSNAELTGTPFSAHYTVRLDGMPDWLLREPAAARPALSGSCWDDGGPWTQDPRLTKATAHTH
jgi:hypothetical protein